MTMRDLLDVAHALWADQEGRVRVARALADAGRPVDEGWAAQAAQDAMLGGDLL